MKRTITLSLTSRLLLAAFLLCLSSTAWADDIVIPTTSDNPFDLKKGVITSEDTHEHFTNNGLEWMRDGDYITFSIQNEKDVEFYNVTVYADTGNRGVSIDFNLKSENGNVVVNSTIDIEQTGWYSTKPYRVQTPAMKKGKYTLTLTFHSTPGNTTGNVKSILFQTPEPLVFPTDNDHPLDLTKGIVLSSSTKEHFTENGVENMKNDDQLIYIIQNQEDLDVCNVYVGANTGYNDIVSLSFELKTLGGEVVADTTYQIMNKGWYNNVIYALQLHQLKKGNYILTFTFHQTYNNTWFTCNIGSIALMKPKNLKYGDEVQIVNPEFDDGLNGWELSNRWNNPDEFGNKYALAHFNGGSTGYMWQTAYNLPDGIYLLRMSMYDSTPGDPLEQDTYIFLNDREKLMKNAYADANSYRNIYRRYQGKDNGSYRRTIDGRFAPTHQLQWNESLNMAERLYTNCVVAVVNGGQATFGWKKTEKARATRITLDHVALIYLSENTDLSAYAQTVNTIATEEELATAIENALCSDYLEERISALEETIRTELNAKRAHAPQAIAEAKGAIDTDIAYKSDGERIDAILHLEHLIQRLQLPFYDITLNSPGTLAELLTTQGIQATDTIALKLNGTLNDDDLATLKTLKSIMEIDLSATTLTVLPEAQFMQMRLLTWVTLPEHLETMGNSVFNGCYELRDLKLPATLKSVGDYCFRYTYNFYRADIPEGLTVNNGAYRNSGMRYVTLPTSMKEVPYICFSDCYDLIDVQFNKQSTIGQEAFASCVSLRAINLPEGIQRFKDGCFRACTGLTSATLPSTAIWLSSPFFNCKNLKELTCLVAAPPYTSDRNIHGDMSSKGCTLYVPMQSVDDYQNAERWCDFDVVGIDTLPATINIISSLTIDQNESLPADYKPNVSLTALYSYWGGNVLNIATYGSLTVDGTATFSTNQLTTIWNPFALRSTANRGTWFPTYTSVINNGHLRADNVTIEMNIYENCWEFITFPFDVRVGDIRYYFPDAPLVIYGYDAKKRAEGKNSETWVKMTADSILQAGRGYIWQTHIPQDQMDERWNLIGGDYNAYFNKFYIDALPNANKQKFFRNEDVEVTLQKYPSEFAHDRSWNLIGNPYPSYFDLHKIETTAPIIAWNFTSSSDGQYRAYSPLDDDLILFPGQAFFVQCPLDQDKLVFLKEGRQHDLSLHYDVEEARAAKARAIGQPRYVYNLLLTGNPGESGISGISGESGNSPSKELDRTRFVINEAAALDYEPGRDANKFMSLDANAAHLYVLRDGVRYAIDERPFANGRVQLGLKTAAEGTYTISLGTSHTAKQNGSLTLIDHETGTETDLATCPYTFTAKAGTTDSRFTIYLCGVTAVQSVAAESQPAEQLYDLLGRPISNPQPGIYVRNNKKVIIK